MKKKIKVLHCENNDTDAELIESRISTNNLNCDFTRVFNKEEYHTALMKEVYDVILCDSKMKDIEWISAVKLAKEISPHTAFIIISPGTGEEKANEVLKYGATDFISKSKLSALIPAIKRAVMGIAALYGVSSHWG
jgi:DNA-binding NtrC family response regulator